MRITDKYVFFFTDKDIFSNWYIAPFVDHEADRVNLKVESPVSFTCVEQYMMWRKASLFYDYDIASSILSGNLKRDGEKLQAYYKRMGRRVEGYKEDVWLYHRKGIIKNGLFMKYNQNPELKTELMKHADKVFVEANPYDAIYGIKMGMWDNGVEDSDNWKGQNLLGKWHNDLIRFYKTARSLRENY